MRRSMMMLALRIDTSLSRGCRCMGMETRSSGPIGDVGVLREYRIFGARGLLVISLST